MLLKIKHIITFLKHYTGTLGFLVLFFLSFYVATYLPISESEPIVSYVVNWILTLAILLFLLGCFIFVILIIRLILIEQARIFIEGLVKNWRKSKPELTKPKIMTEGIIPELWMEEEEIKEVELGIWK